MENNLKVTVNNLPMSYEKFVVARVVDNELWYWGSWENEADAQSVATAIDGVVVEAE